ncbi:MAG: hypothetical protein Q4E70_00760 [Candidatus Saccharibacteria bacterium]|nr:hypothetical protein [Candidatus Saccharibacteria bacterium]
MVRKSERNSNSRLAIFSILTLVFLAILGFIVFLVLKNSEVSAPVVSEQVVLDSEYVGTDGKQIEMTEISEDVSGVLEGLISEKKSFVVYVSLPVCSGVTAEFKEHVLKFQKENKLSFYYLTSDYVKDTSIYNSIKYFPSVIIYNKGEMVNFLRFDSDEDKGFYSSYDGFSKWFKANVSF